ncbi:MAG TPA: glycosyltransferase family 2 protein [Actinomycetes bacterium]|nr:glycosyltransferase family 2 protein [Actinomycetes bacterium]
MVVPTRDRPALLPRAVASALAQTVTDIEVVVVDDGSIDPVRLASDDHHLRVIRLDRPMGPCAARNRALAVARGRWVTFLDDDDELEPEMLALSLRAAKDSALPAPVAVLTGVRVVDEGGRVLETRRPMTLPRGRRYPLEAAGTGSRLNHNTLVAPREVLCQIRGFDERLPAWEHDDLFLRLNAVCSIQGVPTVGYRQTVQATPGLSGNLLARAAGIEHTLAKHRGTYATDPGRRAYLLGAMGLAYLRSGRWRQAIAASSRSLLVRPRWRTCGWWVACLAGPRAVTVSDRWRTRLAERRRGARP